MPEQPARLNNIIAVTVACAKRYIVFMGLPLDTYQYVRVHSATIHDAVTDTNPVSNAVARIVAALQQGLTESVPHA
jgi:hypothetical protein